MNWASSPRTELLAVITLLGISRSDYDRIVAAAEARARVSDWTVAELLHRAKPRLLQTGSADAVIEEIGAHA